MNEIIKVDYSGEKPLVSARELHEFLEVKTSFKDWFPRMCEYGFTEGTDFCSFLSESSGGRPGKDAALSIDMAKEICMLQRNEKGKIARQYFIQLEKDWNSPEKVMARALRIAEGKIKELTASNASLAVDLEIARPKAEYFDELVDRGLLTNFRDTAKELGIGQREFTKFLLERKYIYRDSKGKLLPYAKYVDNGLFEVKECINQKTEWSGLQTLITPKGREIFNNVRI